MPRWNFKGEKKSSSPMTSRPGTARRLSPSLCREIPSPSCGNIQGDWAWRLTVSMLHRHFKALPARISTFVPPVSCQRRLQMRRFAGWNVTLPASSSASSPSPPFCASCPPGPRFPLFLLRQLQQTGPLGYRSEVTQRLFPSWTR